MMRYAKPSPHSTERMMSYDTKCFEIARAFLSDYKANSPMGQVPDAEHLAPELAQEIQDLIDGFITEKGLTL
jgi:hypothetical protein